MPTMIYTNEEGREIVVKFIREETREHALCIVNGDPFFLPIKQLKPCFDPRPEWVFVEHNMAVIIENKKGD